MIFGSRSRRLVAVTAAWWLVSFASDARAEPLDLLTTPIDGPVHALAQTPDGLLWVGTDEGLVRFDGRRATTLDAPAPRGPRGRRCLALTRDRGGYLWVGTAEGGLHRFDGRRFHFHARPGTAGASYTVHALLHDATGRVWIATPEKLMRYERQVGSTGEELPGISIAAMTLDPQEVVWAVGGTSLYRRVFHGFQRVTLPLDVDVQPLHTLAFRGETTLWLGRDDGLLRLEGELAQGGLPLAADRIDGVDGPVRALLEERGTLWIGLDSGLRRSDAAGPARPTPIAALDGRGVRALLFGREGILWVGTSEGLVGLVPSDPRDPPSDARPLPPSLLSARIGEVPLELPAVGRTLRFEIPADGDGLDLELTTPRFRSADVPSYRWRLDDGAWSGTDRSATDRSDADTLRVALPSRSSRLEIQAEGPDGAWSPSLVLVLTRPRRVGLWWTLGVAALVALGGLAWWFLHGRHDGRHLGAPRPPED